MQNYARPQIMWQIVPVGVAILELSVYLQQQTISNKAIHYKSSPKIG
jgi:hypothetical protein